MPENEPVDLKAVIKNMPDAELPKFTEWLITERYRVQTDRIGVKMPKGDFMPVDGKKIRSFWNEEGTVIPSSFDPEEIEKRLSQMGQYKGNDGAITFVGPDGMYWVGYESEKNMQALEEAGYRGGLQVSTSVNNIMNADCTFVDPQLQKQWEQWGELLGEKQDKPLIPPAADTVVAQTGEETTEAEVKNLLQQHMQLSGFKEGETREESQKRGAKITLLKNRLMEVLGGKEIYEARRKAQEELNKTNATIIEPTGSLLDNPQQVALLGKLFQAYTLNPELATTFSNYLKKYHLWVEGGSPYDSGELRSQEIKAFLDFDHELQVTFNHSSQEHMDNYDRARRIDTSKIMTLEEKFWKKAQAGQFQTINEMREAMKEILEIRTQNLNLIIIGNKGWSEFYATLAQEAGLRIVPGQNNGHAGLAEA